MGVQTSISSYSAVQTSISSYSAVQTSISSHTVVQTSSYEASSMDYGLLLLLLLLLTRGVSVLGAESLFTFPNPPQFQPMRDNATNKTWLQVSFFTPDNAQKDYSHIDLYQDDRFIKRANKLPKQGEPAVCDATTLDPCIDHSNLNIRIDKADGNKIRSFNFDYESSKYCV